MDEKLIGALRQAGDGDLAIEMTTLGGGADFARRIALEVKQARGRHPGRLLFLGKTVVYSAGTTVMAAFPREDRYLTADAVLMIHCRQMEEKIALSGPIRSSLPQLEAASGKSRSGSRSRKGASASSSKEATSAWTSFSRRRSTTGT